MMLHSCVASCYSIPMTKIIKLPEFTADYRAEFVKITDTLEGITAQAVADQQAGIPSNRGRTQYSDIAESSHYINAWMKSMTLNGPAR
jgi:hypothetical protein